MTKLRGPYPKSGGVSIREFRDVRRAVSGADDVVLDPVAEGLVLAETLAAALGLLGVGRDHFEHALEGLEAFRDLRSDVE